MSRPLQMKLVHSKGDIPSALPPCEDITKKVVVPEVGSHQTQNLLAVGILILNFPASKTEKFLLFASHPVYDVLLAAYIDIECNNGIFSTLFIIRIYKLRYLDVNQDFLLPPYSLSPYWFCIIVLDFNAFYLTSTYTALTGGQVLS